MKKAIKLIGCLALCLLLGFAFSACDKDPFADKFSVDIPGGGSGSTSEPDDPVYGNLKGNQVATGSVKDLKPYSATILGKVDKLLTGVFQEVGVEVVLDGMGFSSFHCIRKQSSGITDGKFEVSLVDYDGSGLLESEMTYSYRVYVNMAGVNYYGETKKFTTPNFTFNTEAAVDLGLSVKWASCNVGAISPEKEGGYFSTINYYGSGSTVYSDMFKLKTPSGTNSLKLADYGFGNWSGDSEWDAATKQLGGSWRTPTREEWQELIENCRWEKMYYNGVFGFAVTDKTGTNSIFIPYIAPKSNTAYIVDSAGKRLYNYSVGSWNSALICYLTADPAAMEMANYVYQSLDYTNLIENGSLPTDEVEVYRNELSVIKNCIRDTRPEMMKFSKDGSTCRCEEIDDQSCNGFATAWSFQLRPVMGTAPARKSATANVTTGNASGITMNEAKVSFSYSFSDSKAAKELGLDYGVLYSASASTSSSLVYGGSKVLKMEGYSYDCMLKGLKSNTTYYYRAYARVGGKYFYGSVKNFKTDGNTNGQEYNGHEYIDLGLPSGLKWATCNVGATKPEEYGDYFAWGETTTLSNYSWEYSSTFGKTIDELKSAAIIGSNGVLTPSYDAARANWGGSWRMPTIDEIKELINNTTTTWTTKNGVYGRKVTSKKNGKYLFLPAAGVRQWTSLSDAGSGGYYWSSSPYEGSYDSSAYRLSFSSSDFDWISHYRYLGQSVRPVSE